MADPTKSTKSLKSKTERALAELGEGMQSSPSAPPRKKEPRSPSEPRGMGSDNTEANARALGAQLRAKIDAAEKSGNKKLADKLRARLKTLRSQ